MARSSLKWIAATVVVVLAAEAAVALGVRWLGLMDVSACAPPSAMEEWLLGGAADYAIASHAALVPAIDRGDPRLIGLGLEHYNEMCVTCHAAPGIDDSEIAQGLNPPAPHLWTADAQELTDAELYWVVKNGIRRTGMPAFGLTHNDGAIRAIVAFVRKLPDLMNGQYAAMVQSAGLSLPSEEGGAEDAEPSGPGRAGGDAQGAPTAEPKAP